MLSDREIQAKSNYVEKSSFGVGKYFGFSFSAQRKLFLCERISRCNEKKIFCRKEKSMKGGRIWERWKNLGKVEKSWKIVKNWKNVKIEKKSLLRKKFAKKKQKWEKHKVVLELEKGKMKNAMKRMNEKNCKSSSIWKKSKADQNSTIQVNVD